MTCPICNKRHNHCDCSLQARENYAYVAKLEALTNEMEELKAIINDDGTLTTHEDHVSILVGMNHAYAQQNELVTENTEQREEIGRLRDALGWYDQQVSSCNKTNSEGDEARDRLAKDYGNRARAALSQDPPPATGEAGA